jgi:hypothetical protein
LHLSLLEMLPTWRAERPASAGKLNHEPTTLVTSANASDASAGFGAAYFGTGKPHNAVAEPREAKSQICSHRCAQDLTNRTRCSTLVLMEVGTLGVARSLGWRVHMHCTNGYRESPANNGHRTMVVSAASF